MSTSSIFEHSDAIISIDARGFIFGAAIAIKFAKPMVLARKPNKLPGRVLQKSYQLEYGVNPLSIQESAIANFQSFVIVDDLLATGGTVKCVSDMLSEAGKDILGLSIVVELTSLNGKSNFYFPVESQITF